ncbi:MAG TPA: DUF493 domain-containing protein [Candidatus Krumholzibacteria bacterium]|nr:DUF493 domain-containing protein [Candidatus Krumholzibacteria bacterium]
MFDPGQRPDIRYPTPWSFKVIGDDEAAVRRAVETTLAERLECGAAERPWDLSTSRTSRGGRYVSLLLSLTVVSEDERNALFAGLAGHPAVRIVI